MARRNTPRGPALIQFDSRATIASIGRAARNAQGRFTEFNQVVTSANRRAISYLTEESLDNLAQEIRKTGRDQSFATGRLEAAIADPKSHAANQDGFMFMRDAAVRPEVPYYRAIERGSKHMVGRSDIPILWLPEGSSGRQWGIGPTRYRAEGFSGFRVRPRIMKPIRPYSYASRARRRMLSQRLWQGWLAEEAARRGIVVEFSGDVLVDAGEP